MLRTLVGLPGVLRLPSPVGIGEENQCNVPFGRKALQACHVEGKVDLSAWLDWRELSQISLVLGNHRKGISESPKGSHLSSKFLH